MKDTNCGVKETAKLWDLGRSFKWKAELEKDEKWENFRADGNRNWKKKEIGEQEELGNNEVKGGGLGI